MATIRPAMGTDILEDVEEALRRACEGNDTALEIIYKVSGGCPCYASVSVKPDRYGEANRISAESFVRALKNALVSGGDL